MALLAHAPNSAIAGLWTSMLEAAGIVAHVPGTYLADEWAIAQRVTGNVASAVYVPRSRLEEARAIIAKHPIASDAEIEEAEADEAPELDDDLPPPVPASEAPAAAAAVTPALSKRAIVFEIIAVCCVTELPSITSSLSGLVARDWRPWDYAWSLESGIERLTWAIPLIVFLRWVISRTGQPLSDFGWVRVRPLRDLVAGAAVLIAFVLVTLLITSIAHAGPAPHSPADEFVMGAPHRPGTPPDGWLHWTVLIASTFAVAFLEELSARGYLLNRLRTLLGSGAQAAAISSAVWASGHLYQGLVPVLLHFIEGLALAAAFFFFKRLWPLVIAHAGFNLLLAAGRYTSP